MGVDDAEPVTASTAAIERTYDRLSGVYSWIVGRWEAPTRKAAIELLNPRPGEHVIDVGCGPGHAVVEIGRRVRPDGSVVGIDISRAMLTRTRRRLETTGPPTAAAVRADARSLPVPDDMVDGVYIAETLELFDAPDIDRVLEEITRVLTPDGRLCVVSMPRAGHQDSLFVRAYEWCYRNVPGYATVGCRPIYLREAIRGAGFEIQTTRDLMRGRLWPITIILARPA